MTVEKKKIAIVVTNLAGSGAEKVSLAQAKLFKENGHDVILVLLEKLIKYDIEKFDFPIISLTKIKNQYKIFGLIGDYIYAYLLKKVIKKNLNKVDIIISNLPRADRVVSLLKEQKTYFVIHMSYKAELEKFSSRRAKKKLSLYRRIYQDKNIITVANDIKKDFDILKILYNNIITIYNPFDFSEIRAKGDEKLDVSFNYIISPSTFRAQKRYDIMLDAFSLIKSDIKLLILTKENDTLKQMIKERNLQQKVVVAGFKQNPYKYIKNAKLLVLSSDREGLPTVIIESLILGTPVVSTNCPTGPKEIMKGKLSEWLTPVGEPIELAKTIDRALKSTIHIEDTLIEKFNKDTICKEFVSLWKN